MDLDNNPDSAETGAAGDVYSNNRVDDNSETAPWEYPYEERATAAAAKPAAAVAAFVIHTAVMMMLISS